MAKGLTNPEIGRVLGISANTVKTHVAAVIEALDVTNRTEAARALAELGLGDHLAAADDAYRVAGFGDRPSIAVLPFDDLTDGEGPAHLAFGLVEDLITRLSANRWFPVIARNSSFVYQGRAVDVRQVSRELGARYLVEGSVRVAGEQVRVTVQFIDGVTGEHLHAERYDRVVGDLFQLQDELVSDILGAIEPGIGRIDRMRAATRAPGDLSAWARTARGMEHLYDGGADDLREARGCFEEAIALDPHLAAAWAGLSQAACVEVINGYCADRETALGEAIRAGERAMGEDPADGLGPSTLAMAHALAGDPDRAMGLFERALELNPSQAPSYWGLGTIRLARGEAGEAQGLFEKAIRLSPHDPMRHHMESYLAAAHAAQGRTEEALQLARRSVERRPDQPFSSILVAAFAAELGRLDEARKVRRALSARAPGLGPGVLRPFLSDELADRIEAGWQRLDSPDA